MKRIAYIFLTFTLMCLSLPAFAVTDAEMAKARAIAAKTYLRFANNGSGYLDDISVSSISELESKLKPKEKENLKAFKAVPVPQDYKSWDKAKLVDYWSTTAFAAKGLKADAMGAKPRVRKLLNKMEVSAPVKAEPKQEASRKEENKTEDPKEQTSAQNDSPATANEAKANDGTSEANTVEDGMTPLAEAEALLSQVPSTEDLDEPIEKAGNYTWVYVLILVILVGVVIALVVFASNTLKKSEGPGRSQESARNSTPLAANADEREKYAAKLAAKNDEIRTLNAKIESLANQNAALKEKLEALAAAAKSVQQERRRVETSPRKEEEPKPMRPEPHQQGSRTIYLGRATGKGIFVRADRSLNPNLSVFRLETSDGFAGTFRVVNDADVWENALDAPQENLAGACILANPEETVQATQVVTDSAGTAVFENGAWRVIRKAKVHFE